MKKKELIRTLKFALFSASAGIIQTVTFTLLNEFVTDKYWYAYLPALVLSVLFNFTVNRKFTFKSASNVPVAMLKVAAYYVVFTPLSTWWGDFLAESWHWNEYAVLALTMAINLSTEYLYQKFVIFKNSIDTNDIAKKEEKK
ncbi:MAG: GtrA family protein [Clostridia bacterium]|nr:GtrA family protein [Clostridia bacterium]